MTTMLAAVVATDADVRFLLASLTAERCRGWRRAAACRGMDPDAFHPVRGASVAQAKTICARCPVRVECLNDALSGPPITGIWVGELPPVWRTGLVSC